MERSALLERPVGPRLATIVQAAADALQAPLAGARVLDLGAAEGKFAVEFAQHGADVVALEGREGNVQKARTAVDARGLTNVEIVKDDVRNLSVERYGRFDLVLCLGLLYHLDAAAAVATAQRVADVCTRAAIFDTHVALRADTRVRVGDRTYAGILQREFDPGATPEEQERLSRSSIGNPESFWPTRPSLYNLLGDAGFSSLAEVVWPYHEKTSDRVILVGYRGPGVGPLSVAAGDAPPQPRWPERARPHRNQSRLAQLRRRVGPFVPSALKELARRRRNGVE